MSLVFTHSARFVPSKSTTASDGAAPAVAPGVTTFGTGKISDEQLIALIRDTFDLRPYGLIRQLDLLQHAFKKAT